jgi:outer membrane lipoprotein-sorting protein
MKRWVIAALMLTVIPSSLFAVSAEEIIRKLEENTVFKTSRVDGDMIIRDRFGTKKSSFISYSRGTDDMLIEFTSVEEEGMKILRTKDELYLFFPEAEETIRMQGAALKESVIGSDMSYEDMTGGKGLLASYNVTLEGTEEINGASCYKVRMEAISSNVPYYSQTMWIDTTLFIYRRVHKFSRSGKLLKNITISEIREVSGRHVPVRMVLEDTVKGNSSTEFIVRAMKIDIPLDPRLFSLEELSW